MGTQLLQTANIMRQEEKLHTDTEDTEENNAYYYKTGRESTKRGDKKGQKDKYGD